MAVRFLSSPFAADADAQTPRRMLAIQTDMGILPQYFWPEGRGMDYKPSPYLEILQDYLESLGDSKHPNFAK